MKGLRSLRKVAVAISAFWLILCAGVARAASGSDAAGDSVLYYLVPLAVLFIAFIVIAYFLLQYDKKNKLRSVEFATYRKNRDAEGLVKYINDTDKNRRFEAIRLLGEIRDARVIGPLVGLLREQDDRVQASAIRTLEQYGEAAAEPLIYYTCRKYYVDMLAKGGQGSPVEIGFALRWDETVKMTVQYIVVNFGPATIPYLIRALKNPDKSVRAISAKLIKDFGDLAVQPLTQAMQDDDEAVRANAESMLREIKDSR